MIGFNVRPAGKAQQLSEQEGVDGADPELFGGAVWVLTPTAGTDDGAFATVRSIVASLGADVVALSPDRHDALVAVVSHVPHLTAATLMLVTSPSAGAPQPLINYFQPMPIVGKLSMTVWGAPAVGPRDPANGLEDNGRPANAGFPRKRGHFDLS